jgi:hypothetical protein
LYEKIGNDAYKWRFAIKCISTQYQGGKK